MDFIFIIIFKTKFQISVKFQHEFIEFVHELALILVSIRV